MVIFRGWATCVKDFLKGSKVRARDQENRKEAVLPLLVRSSLFGSDSSFSPLTEKGWPAVE